MWKREQQSGWETHSIQDNVFTHIKFKKSGCHFTKQHKAINKSSTHFENNVLLRVEWKEANSVPWMCLFCLCQTQNCKQDVLWWSLCRNSPVNTQTTLHENTKKKINNLLHFTTGASLTFYRVADSSSGTQKETEAIVTSTGKTRRQFAARYS